MITSVEYVKVAVEGKCPLGFEGSPYGPFSVAATPEEAREKTTALLLEVPGVVRVEENDCGRTCFFMTGFDETGAAVEGYGVMIDHDK